jgi:hypothetical protein
MRWRSGFITPDQGSADSGAGDRNRRSPSARAPPAGNDVGAAAITHGGFEKRAMIVPDDRLGTVETDTRFGLPEP